MSHRVVIVGAGAAGVFTAFRLREMYGDRYQIHLLEKHDRIGGNAYSREVTYGGKRYSIDCGAQFFYKNPQVSYVELLETLGLFDHDDFREIISAPAGVTIWDRKRKRHSFHLPSRLRGFARYGADDWGRLVEFIYFIAYCYFFDRGEAPWTLSLEQWLGQCSLLSDDFKQNVIKDFLYQFVTLPRQRIGEASARYAITYFVRNALGEPRVDEPSPSSPSIASLPLFETYQSLIGLDGVMKKALERAGVSARLSTPAQAVSRTPAGGLVVHAGGEAIECDYVVLASDPPTSARLLEEGGQSPDLVATLRQLEYAPLRISMQKDGSCYMPDNRSLWEPINTIVDGDAIMFSAWFGPLRAKYGLNEQIPVFKSWGTPGLDPKDCPHRFLRHAHRIVQPTTDFMVAREAIRQAQGRGGIWFAGGWTNWFDSQEAALDSATEVADGLPGIARPHTGPAHIPRFDRDQHGRTIRRWIARISRRAPDDKKQPLENALDVVETIG